METRVLVVKSDNLFRSQLVERLKKEYVCVTTAEAYCRPDIKKIIKKNRIDVVVLDLSELKKEGLMILERIHSSRIQAEVILINSPDQLSLSIEGMKLGAFNDYHMPLDMEIFMAGIREAAAIKKQRGTKSFMQRYQDVMAAVTFAEAGEHDAAKEFLEKRSVKNLTDDKQLNKIIKTPMTN